MPTAFSLSVLTCFCVSGVLPFEQSLVMITAIPYGTRWGWVTLIHKKKRKWKLLPPQSETTMCGDRCQHCYYHFAKVLVWVAIKCLHVTREDEYAISNSGRFCTEAMNHVTILSLWLFSHFTFFKALYWTRLFLLNLCCSVGKLWVSVCKCLFGSETVNEGFAMTQESFDCDSSNLYWKFFAEAGVPDWECTVLCSHTLYWQALRCD